MPPSRATLAAKHQRVRELAAAGTSTLAIARTLHMDRGDVRKVRNAAGYPVDTAARPRLSLDAAWRTHVRPADGGHLEWTGSRQSSSGTPVMRYRGRTHTAARIAYRIKHGTDPIGYALPGCGTAHCVAPDHITDTATTRAHTAPRARYDTAEEKLAALTRTAADGHTEWAGPVTRAGFPLLPWRGRSLMPGRIAFAARYGREPEGRVTAACGMPHCLTGDHLDDRLTRASHRAAYAALGI